MSNLPQVPDESKQVVAGVGGTAAAGAIIGSIVPGAGTLIGAGIGAIIGGIGVIVAVAISNDT
ncbi:MAG: hypothetical protein FWG77_03910 [Treponema sp.]|nr:hypothetical protein [Treponema sp.]